jgi:ferredoxin-NADP reductase
VNETPANPSIMKNLAMGTIDKNFIMREIPDYSERIFYLSGPRSMIFAFKRQLKALGVPHTNIKTDFFPGLV